MKANIGISPEAFVVGTVMRNQRRKLYDDLFMAFRGFLDTQEKPAYLYIHTAHPDAGWNIPELIVEHGLSRFVLTTYKCRLCGHFFSSFYRDARTACEKCNQISALTCSPTFGLMTNQLPHIYNLFDLYVQYATNEGFGLPVVEASACGVPTAVVDISAMSDFVSTIGSNPIENIVRRDVDNNSYKAVPYNSDLVDILTKYGNMPRKIIDISS